MELGPSGSGTKRRAITISLSLQCGSYNRALRNELPQVFPVGGVCGGWGWGGAVVTNDWYVISHYVRLLGRCITLTPTGPPSILVN